jgi:hypothetical protein
VEYNANLVGDAGGHDGSDGISTGFECAGNSVHHLKAKAGLLAEARRFRMRTLALSTTQTLWETPEATTAAMASPQVLSVPATLCITSRPKPVCWLKRGDFACER